MFSVHDQPAQNYRTYGQDSTGNQNYQNLSPSKDPFRDKLMKEKVIANDIEDGGPRKTRLFKEKALEIVHPDQDPY